MTTNKPPLATLRLATFITFLTAATTGLRDASAHSPESHFAEYQELCRNIELVSNLPEYQYGDEETQHRLLAELAYEKINSEEIRDITRALSLTDPTDRYKILAETAHIHTGKQWRCPAFESVSKNWQTPSPHK